MSIGLAAKIKQGRFSPDSFWKHPEPEQRKHGEPSPHGIFMAVGHSLTEWAILEETLAMIFQMLCAPTSGDADRAAMLTFGSIEGVSSRIKAIKAVAEVYFGQWWEYDGIQKVLNAIDKDFTAAARIRNEIAHGKVMGLTRIYSDDNGAQQSQDSGFLLVSQNYMTGRNSLFATPIQGDKFVGVIRSLYRYNSQDIMSFGDKFRWLNGLLLSYMSEIPKDETTSIPRIIADEIKADDKAFQRKMNQLENLRRPKQQGQGQGSSS